MKIEILGVKIDNLSLQEVLEKIEQFLNSKFQHYIVTPNPEFLVLAQKDKNFKEILNYADIAIADGIGLIYAAKFLKKPILQKITGTDLMWQICELVEHKNCSIYLLGAEEGIAKKTAEVLKENFSKLKIVGTESGGQVEVSSREQITPSPPTPLPEGEGGRLRRPGEGIDIIKNINQAKPKILFVAFGQIKQEKWIFYNLDKLPSVKLAMGVGGAFDYISGNIKRAPKILQTLGLEWLYRLIQEPRRWKRIFKAVIVFPLLVLKQKLTKKKEA